MILALTIAAAAAQDVPDLSLNTQLYRPAIASPHFLWTDESGLTTDGGFSARAALHWANDPVVYRGPEDERVAVLDDVVQTDVSAAWRARRLLLGVNVPAVLRATSDIAEPQAGLGDLAGEVRVTALHRDAAPVGLALGARGWLPTATTGGPLAASAASFEGQLVVDRQISDLLLAANLGYRLRADEPSEAVSWDDQLVGRVGAAWSASDAVGLSLDLAGQAAWRALEEPAARPMEIMGGGWVALGAASLRAGVGTGLGSGLGAPRLRTVLALDLQPDRQREVAAPSSAPAVSPPAAASPPLAEDAPAPTQTEPTLEAPAELSVRVMDPAGVALRATVQLIDLDTAASWMNAQLFEVASGAYTVFVEAPGFAPVRQEIRLDAEQRMVIDVVLTPTD